MRRSLPQNARSDIADFRGLLSSKGFNAPRDFEHLVRELFEEEFRSRGGEVPCAPLSSPLTRGLLRHPFFGQRFTWNKDADARPLRFAFCASDSFAQGTH